MAKRRNRAGLGIGFVSKTTIHRGPLIVIGAGRKCDIEVRPIYLQALHSSGAFQVVINIYGIFPVAEIDVANPASRGAEERTYILLESDALQDNAPEHLPLEGSIGK